MSKWFNCGRSLYTYCHFRSWKTLKAPKRWHCVALPTYRNMQKNAVNVNSLEAIRISLLLLLSQFVSRFRNYEDNSRNFLHGLRANGIAASGVPSSVEVQTSHRAHSSLIWAGLGSNLGPEVTYPDCAFTSGSLGTYILLENCTFHICPHVWNCNLQSAVDKTLLNNTSNKET